MSEKNDEVVETDPEILISQFSKKFSENYTPEEWKKIQSAWDYLISKTSDLKRKCGKPYYLHPLRVATILAEKNLGADTIIAGFFHNILDVDNDCLPEIEEKFGKDISVICNGTAKITGLKINSTSLHQADSIQIGRAHV